MNRIGAFLLAGAAVAMLAAPAGAEKRRRPAGPGTANPSELIATEIAFARAAREDGQWTAFRKFADDEAVMFVPQPVMAKDWLKGQQDPAQPVQWEPYQVWMSCDGTLGVTKGAWHRPDGSVGYFTTIWKQQKKGEYRWVLDQGDALSEPLVKPDWLSASVADCPQRGSGPPPHSGNEDREKRREAGMTGYGQADDGTLRWSYKVSPDKSRVLSVYLRKSGSMNEVLSSSVAGQAN